MFIRDISNRYISQYINKQQKSTKCNFHLLLLNQLDLMDFYEYHLCMGTTHITTQQLLNGFSFNFILGNYTKIC
jgi:hypothetical protein